MEQYRRETERLVKRFLQRRISFIDLNPALDSELTQLIPRMRRQDFDELRTVMISNLETVMKEMERRSAIRRPGSN